MKKFLFVSVLCVLSFANAPARADSMSFKGLYLSIGGGLNWSSDADNKGAVLDIRSDYNVGYVFAGALGLKVNDMLRVEAEFSYRNNDVDSLRVTNPATFAGITAGADGDVRSYGLMANLYLDFDLGQDSLVKPYIMGGVGGARVIADVSSNGVSIVDDGDYVFAYQLGTGLGYDISDQTVLDLGYRYFGTSDPELTDDMSGAFDSEYGSHAVMLYLRHTLN